MIAGERAKARRFSGAPAIEGQWTLRRDYPTVSRGTERSRITPSPMHLDADVEYLVEAPGIIWSELRMLKAA